MKKLVLVLIVVSILSLGSAFPVTAATKPVGGCPTGFTLHEVGEHMDHPDHHIGLAADLNGNGFLCMKPLGNELHVHVDDVIY